MNEAGLRPLELFPGADVAWRSQCMKCRNEVNPRWSNVRLRGRGCVFCAEWGFDRIGPSVLYLIEDTARDVRKIGVTGLATTRLGIWGRRGWDISRVWEFSTGAAASWVEQAVLTWWRKTLSLPAKLGGEDGWTETVDANSITAEQVVQYVDGLRLSFEPASAVGV